VRRLRQFAGGNRTPREAADRIEALEAALLKAKKRFLEISRGEAFQPALHARDGAAEVHAALTPAPAPETVPRTDPASPAAPLWTLLGEFPTDRRVGDRGPSRPSSAATR
jgi:hypothetical protein